MSDNTEALRASFLQAAKSARAQPRERRGPFIIEDAELDAAIAALSVEGKQPVAEVDRLRRQVHECIKSADDVYQTYGAGSRTIIQFGPARDTGDFYAAINGLRVLPLEAAPPSLEAVKAESYRQGLEDAAKVADQHATSSCSGLNDDTAAMRLGARSIAAIIRAIPSEKEG